MRIRKGSYGYLQNLRKVSLLKSLLLLAAVFAVIMLISRKIKNDIKEKGIETDAVVSRISDDGSPDEVDINVYVRYRTEIGEEIEGILINAPDDLAPGQKVRIKYHPRYKMNARLIEIL